MAIDETVELIKKLEVTKSSKKLIAKYLKSLNDDRIEEVTQFLYTLPLFMESKWEILNSLKLEAYEDFIYDEILACSEDLNCATWCSSLVIGMSRSRNNIERIAKVIYNALSSPSKPKRSNAMRSWISRMISDKLTISTIHQIINLAEKEILYEEEFLENIEYRELIGVTCIDLEWKSKFDFDPVSRRTLAYYAYFNILLSTLVSRSQIKLEVNENILELGMHFVDSEVRLLSYSVARAFKIYPKSLEEGIIEDLENEDVFNIATSMKNVFTENGNLEISRVKQQLDEERKKSSRFYPAEKKTDIIPLNLGNYSTTLESVVGLLKFQSNDEFPSVAKVMENFRNRNIDERFYVEKIIEVLNYSSSQDWEIFEISDLILRIISRCPLRAIVDYGGEIIRKKCVENEEFRISTFNYSLNLLRKSEENSRALFFEVTLIATILKDQEKMKETWENLKTLPSIKKRKMFEMLANVIGNTSTSIAFEQLREMLLYSIGILDSPCTQLFESVVSKLLGTQHETDRCYLFTQNDEIFELLEEILSNLKNLKDKKSIHLTLYLFSRFAIGSLLFYSAPKVLIIQKMTKFIKFCLKKFENDEIMKSAAIDAICAIIPWNYIRDLAYEENENDIDFKYFHYWEIFRDAVKNRDFVNNDAILDLSGPSNISKYFETDNFANISIQSFSDKHTVAFLIAKISRKDLSIEKKRELLLLSSRLLEDLEGDESFEEYKMVFSWLSRAFCYLGIIDFPKRFSVLRKTITQNLLQM
ncbi:unnamed protein product [Caenorhabditis angaria]|uniref:Uncharacterized protein n=1 Tax=Caenorhabditis angaria TaxID=860376 RepID=A0A9P1I138_9PELO|nr:unnamed protein product [Caenorhabditis angaria]